jgi:D-alanine-D-alanine ligase-like ATP-grasp enzyme
MKVISTSTGYRDSGADIAYTLQTLPNIKVITPITSPDPSSVTGWTFPDTASGILSAINAGVTHVWANTILFSSHPLQTLQELDQYEDQVRIVGQPSNLVQLYDDKEYVNNLLRSQGFTLPKSWTLTSSASLDPERTLKELVLPYPIVGKPIRGRGGSGVKLCHTFSELASHVTSLFKDSPTVMLEEYLSGEECTVTVMPPSAEHPDYWALPTVTRFNHDDGIAPYNGVVAVTANSKVVSQEEKGKDQRYDEIAKECVEVARLLKITAPIRIDARRFGERKGETFALFDVNMKPVSSHHQMKIDIMDPNYV